MPGVAKTLPRIWLGCVRPDGHLQPAGFQEFSRHITDRSAGASFTRIPPGGGPEYVAGPGGGQGHRGIRHQIALGVLHCHCHRGGRHPVRRHRRRGRRYARGRRRSCAGADSGGLVDRAFARRDGVATIVTVSGAAIACPAAKEGCLEEIRCRNSDVADATPAGPMLMPTNFPKQPDNSIRL